MLDIESLYPSSTYAYGGSGIFDIAKNLLQKSSSAAIAKKVINSTTANNLKRAANSAVGKELQKHVLSGVSKASERAAESVFDKLGIEPSKKKRKKVVKKKKKGGGIVRD